MQGGAQLTVNNNNLNLIGNFFTRDDFPQAADSYEYFDILNKFDEQFDILIPNVGDSLINFNFHMSMLPLPIGWRYKRSWVKHAIKNIEIKIGGATIWTASREWIKIQNLMIENKNKELIFDYDDSRRTILSQETHEVIFTPFNLEEILKWKFGLPLVCLPFHQVRITGRFGSFQDCIESYIENPPQLGHDYINTNELILKLRHYNHEERRRLVGGDNETIIIKNSAWWNVTTREQAQYLNIDDKSIICSGAYIHITDAVGNEIPRQMIKSINIYFNNSLRDKLSGFQSRHVVRNDMPHPVNQNIESSNLYFISYWPHRTTTRGAEQGVQLSVMDKYTIEICYENWVPNNMIFNIVVANRSLNRFRTSQGVGGLCYVDNGIMFNCSTVFRPVINNNIVFQHANEVIRIHRDEVCRISHEPFEEGLQVDQCNTCHNVFTATLLEQWFNTRTVKNCPLCRTVYSTTTFKRGKVAFIENG